MGDEDLGGLLSNTGGGYGYDDIIGSNISQGEGAGTGDYAGVNVDFGGTDPLTAAQDASGTGSESDWSKLLKLLGLGTGGAAGAGGLNLNTLLTLLAGLGTTAYGASQRNSAAADIKGAADKSNDRIESVLTQQNAAYAPYSAAGTAALGKWAAMPPSDLASKHKGMVSLGSLAKRY